MPAFASRASFPKLACPPQSDSRCFEGAVCCRTTLTHEDLCCLSRPILKSNPLIFMGRQRQICVEMGPLLCHAEPWVVGAGVCMCAAILRGTHVRSWLPFRDQSHVLGSGTSDGDRAMSEASKAKCHLGHSYLNMKSFIGPFGTVRVGAV